MPFISETPQASAFLENEGASKSTQNWLQVVRQGINSLWRSGPTSDRPHDPLLGQLYYDLTLPALVVCTQVASSPHTNDAVWTPITGGGGFIQADYVLYPAGNASITNYRLLTAGSNITITDGGAQGPVTISAAGGSGTVTSITATSPIVVTPSPITGTGDIEHATSGVTPATYGDSTHVAQFTVTDKGHITAASNVAISGGGTQPVLGLILTFGR